MTELQQIRQRWESQEYDSIDQVIRAAHKIGHRNGFEKGRNERRIQKAHIWKEAWEAGRESIDEDKIALKHLIPESGLIQWNKMNQEERMSKMHELWDWQKKKQVTP